MRHLTLILAALVVGCDLNIFGPEHRFPGLRAMIDVPSWYQSEYDAVESCLETDGNFGRLTLRIADRVLRNGRDVGGLWQRPHTITWREDHHRLRRPVRHEFAHDILQVGSDAHLPDGTMPCAQEKGWSSH